MRTFRYLKCRCLAVEGGGTYPVRCPVHGNPIDLRPVGKATVTDQNNLLQKGYGNHLEYLKRAGSILDYQLNSIRFRLTSGEASKGDPWFKPDYSVWMPDRTLEMHECKGLWREAARVRIKIARSLYPHIIWKVVYQDGHSYRIEEV